MERKIIENVAHEAKAGFTLVELLVVVAIIGILGAVAVQNVTQHIARTRIVATQEAIATIGQALTTYSLDHNGKFPDSLEALTEGDDDNPPAIEGGVDALNDAWGTPIQYEKRGKRFKLTSAGPDSEFGTEDDLSNIADKK
jgi:general secretion pathway protein G